MGYMGEKTVLIDDFYGQIPFAELLNILDGHRLQLNVKGSHAYAAFDTVIITSNESPLDWYPRIRDELREALFFRLSRVIKLNAESAITLMLNPELIFQFGSTGVELFSSRSLSFE